MPAKRSLWAKRIINFNYLINAIHLWASRVIPPARASGTAVEKRDSANLSLYLNLDTLNFDVYNTHYMNSREIIKKLQDDG